MSKKIHDLLIFMQILIQFRIQVELLSMIRIANIQRIFVNSKPLIK